MQQFGPCSISLLLFRKGSERADGKPRILNRKQILLIHQMDQPQEHSLTDTHTNTDRQDRFFLYPGGFRTMLVLDILGTAISWP